MMKPLEGIVVVDFSQFLSAPSASLRLADLGARVIKIEQPGMGDLSRDLFFSNIVLDGESSMFAAVNRNKLSYKANLKDEKEKKKVDKLIQQADVVVITSYSIHYTKLYDEYQIRERLYPNHQQHLHIGN